MYENNIIKNMFKVTQHPFLIFAERVEDKTDNSVETLQLIAREGEVTAGRISEYLDIKPSSVTQIIKKLENIGAIEKIKSTEDARVTLVKLTQKGQESISHRHDSSSQLKSELFKHFTEDDLKQFDSYLDLLIENISSDEFSNQLKKTFSDDERWQKFDKMSAHFSKAREQMMESGRFEDPRRFHHFDKRNQFRGRGPR